MTSRTTAVVTGATSGIGLHTARRLSAAGYRVVVHGRTPEKAAQAAREAGAEAHVAADLASLGSVRRLASDIERIAAGPIGVLVNNAGVFDGRQEGNCPSRLVSPDGLELTFAVNVVAPFLLTGLLASSGVITRGSHVINVASISQRASLNLDDLNFVREAYSGHHAYEASKTATVAWTMAAAGRFRNVGVRYNALDPGTVNTKMLLTGWGPIGIDLADADDELLLATEPGAFTGQYRVGNAPRPVSRWCASKSNQDMLWSRLEEFSGF
jgi:NAD(P)-dependent dehydrogenase (short-subunit alcohol dehydrogenase family)